MTHSGPLKSPLPFLPGTSPLADGPDSFSCVFEAILESHRAKGTSYTSLASLEALASPGPTQSPFFTFELPPQPPAPRPDPPASAPLAPLEPDSGIPALLLMGLGHREGRKRRQRLEPSRPQGGSPLVPAAQKTATGWGQLPWAGE